MSVLLALCIVCSVSAPGVVTRRSANATCDTAGGCASAPGVGARATQLRLASPRDGAAVLQSDSVFVNLEIDVDAGAAQDFVHELAVGRDQVCIDIDERASSCAAMPALLSRKALVDRASGARLARLVFNSLEMSAAALGVGRHKLAFRMETTTVPASEREGDSEAGRVRSRRFAVHPSTVHVRVARHASPSMHLRLLLPSPLATVSAEGVRVQWSIKVDAADGNLASFYNASSSALLCVDSNERSSPRQLHIAGEDTAPPSRSALPICVRLADCALQSGRAGQSAAGNAPLLTGASSAISELWLGGFVPGAHVRLVAYITSELWAPAVAAEAAVDLEVETTAAAQARVPTSKPTASGVEAESQSPPSPQPLVVAGTAVFRDALRAAVLHLETPETVTCARLRGARSSLESLECARVVVVNLTDKNLMHGLLPWYRQLRRLGYDHSYLVVALDSQTMMFCREHSLLCVRWQQTPAEDALRHAGHQGTGRGANPHTRHLRADIGFVKFSVTLALIELERTVLFSEMDVVWVHDPLPAFLGLEASVVLQGARSGCSERWCGLMAGALPPWRCGGTAHKAQNESMHVCDLLITAHSMHSRVNIGVYLARPTRRMQQFLSDLLRLHQRSMFDQTEFDLLLGNNCDTAELHGSREWRWMWQSDHLAQGLTRSDSGAWHQGGRNGPATPPLRWLRLDYNVFAGGDGVEKYSDIATVHTFKPMTKESLKELYAIADGALDAKLPTVPAAPVTPLGRAVSWYAEHMRRARLRVSTGHSQYLVADTNSTVDTAEADALSMLVKALPPILTPLRSAIYGHAFVRPGLFLLLTPPLAPPAYPDLHVGQHRQSRQRPLKPNEMLSIELQVDLAELPELGRRGGKARCEAAFPRAPDAGEKIVGVAAEPQTCVRLRGSGFDAQGDEPCVALIPDGDQALRAPNGRVSLPAYMLGPFSPGEVRLETWLQLRCSRTRGSGNATSVDVAHVALTEKLPIRALAT